MIMRPAGLGIGVVMGEDAESEFRILVEDLALADAGVDVFQVRRDLRRRVSYVRIASIAGVFLTVASIAGGGCRTRRRSRSTAPS